VVGTGAQVLEAARIPASLLSGDPDPGLIIAKGGANLDREAQTFLTSLAKHRVYERETDPPRV
jgi:hypothetical protein